MPLHPPIATGLGCQPTHQPTGLACERVRLDQCGVAGNSKALAGLDGGVVGVQTQTARTRPSPTTFGVHMTVGAVVWCWVWAKREMCVFERGGGVAMKAPSVCRLVFPGVRTGLGF